MPSFAGCNLLLSDLTRVLVRVFAPLIFAFILATAISLYFTPPPQTFLDAIGTHVFLPVGGFLEALEGDEIFPCSLAAASCLYPTGTHLFLAVGSFLALPEGDGIFSILTCDWRDINITFCFFGEPLNFFRVGSGIEGEYRFRGRVLKRMDRRISFLNGSIISVQS